MNKLGINIQNLQKSFFIKEQEIIVIQNLSLTLDIQKITVLLGKSGCGKTTLLRMLSGLEQPNCGDILFPFEEKPAIVFQEPRLMPWLTVKKNIAFSLGKKADYKKVNKLIETVGLTGFEQALPSQLSGGMQQRVALARALLYDSPYILTDEPFAALDPFTRTLMQSELLRIQKQYHRGVLFVTHSIDEALNIGDSIIIMDNGSCKQIYDLSEFPQPRDLFSTNMISLKKQILCEI